jgi:hypothetical protein
LTDGSSAVGVAAEIGEVDFAQLLIAKGLETGVLVEERVGTEDGKRQFGFRLT